MLIVSVHIPKLTVPDLPIIIQFPGQIDLSQRAGRGSSASGLAWTPYGRALLRQKIPLKAGVNILASKIPIEVLDGQVVEICPRRAPCRIAKRGISREPNRGCLIVQTLRAVLSLEAEVLTAVHQGILLVDVSHLSVRALRRKLIYIEGICNQTERVPVYGHDGRVQRPGEERIVLRPVGQRENAAQLSLRSQVHVRPQGDGVRIIVRRQSVLPSNLAESILSSACERGRRRRIRKTSLFIGDSKRVLESHRSDMVAKDRKIVVRAGSEFFAAKLRSHLEIVRPLVDGLQKLLSDPFPGAPDICEAVPGNGSPDECAR